MIDYKNLIAQNPKRVFLVFLILSGLLIFLVGLLLWGWFRYCRCRRFCLACQKEVPAKNYVARWNVTAGFCGPCLGGELAKVPESHKQKAE